MFKMPTDDFIPTPIRPRPSDLDSRFVGRLVKIFVSILRAIVPVCR